MTLELVVFLPFLLVAIAALVALARISYGQQLVAAASAAASRSAALASSPAQSNVQARQSAKITLAQGGSSCANASISVDTSLFGPAGSVTVTVRCVARLSDLAIPGVPGSLNLTSSSTTPLEPYRQFDGAKG